MPPELHPLTEKYPPMEADEFAAFKADLAEHGQKNPIWLFEGKVLDGRNRLRACLELGLDPVFGEFAGTEAEAAAFVDSQNLHRRHLTREWRQKRILEMQSEGLSTREIAQELRCHQSTVVRALAVISGDAHASPEISTPVGFPSSASTINGTVASPLNSGDARASPESSLRTHRNKTDSPNLSSDTTPERGPKVHSSATSGPSRIRGRDGKSYSAQRPASPKPIPAPPAKAQWTELATILSELAQKVETLVPTPEENEQPWDLITSLEKTAASLLRQAQRLRRRHHL